MATKTRSPKARKAFLGLDVIVRDPRLQPRFEGLNPGHVADLKDAIRKKAKVPLPKVRLVQEDDGPRYYLTDGWHTTKAYEEDGRFRIECEIREGSWLDAVCDAAAANTSEYHLALKRTDKDKRNAVDTLLKELAAAGEKWSNRRVAEAARVSEGLVRLVLGQDDDGFDDPEPAKPAAKPAPKPAPKPARPAASGAPANGSARVDWHHADHCCGFALRLADHVRDFFPKDAKGDKDLDTFQAHIARAMDLYDTLKARYAK